MTTESANTFTIRELFAKLESSPLTKNHYKLVTAAVLGI
jgi:hypothetical protein